MAKDGEKDVPRYFSHDTNASSDPKIVAMELDFGVIAYAWWWKIVEKLAVQSEYRLPFKKYTFTALANDLSITDKEVETFVEQNRTRVQQNLTPNDFVHLFIICLIDDFELLERDDEYFWAPSLTRRMELRKAKDAETSEKRRLAGIKSGEVRRKNKQNRTRVQQNLTRVEQNELSKVKESKEYIEEREIRARDQSTVIDNPNKKIYDLYMKSMGDISPVIKDRLDDLVELYGMDSTIVAINTTKNNGGNSIKYVETVAAGNLKKEVQKDLGEGKSRQASRGNPSAKGKTDGSDTDWSKVEAKL